MKCMPASPQLLRKFHANPQPASLALTPPVAKAGEMGPFFVNTYLLQPNRKFETFGTVSVRSADLECKK